MESETSNLVYSLIIASPGPMDDKRLMKGTSWSCDPLKFERPLTYPNYLILHKHRVCVCLSVRPSVTI